MGAVVGIAITAMLSTAYAAAAPYPPTEPCRVSVATHSQGQDTATRYDVNGAGLGAGQPVRLSLTATGQTLGFVRTDGSGRFSTSIGAPATAGRRAPAVTAASPRQTCTWNPPFPPTGTDGPGRPGGTGGPGAGAGAGAPGTGGSGGSGPITGGGTDGSDGGSGGDGDDNSGSNSGDDSGTPGTSPPAASGGEGTTPSAGPGATPLPSLTGLPPRAEPRPVTETPFGIGLGIAAALLVLGTLAVLVFTRRSDGQRS